MNRANPAERLKIEKILRGLTGRDLIEAFIGHTELLNSTVLVQIDFWVSHRSG